MIQQLIGAFSYGHEPDSSYLELAKAVAHQTGEALQPGRWLVNSYPARKRRYWHASTKFTAQLLLYSDVDSEVDAICHVPKMGTERKTVVRGDGQDSVRGGEEIDGTVLLFYPSMQVSRIVFLLGAWRV